MKGKRIPFSIFNLFVPFLIFSASSAEELCVDPNDPVCHDTIALAIASVEDGDEIVVVPGTYYENIIIDREVVLRHKRL